jgi:hypothetical protein
MSYAKHPFARLALLVAAACGILSAVEIACAADGIAVLANRDDDDGDGRPDADDDRVNGAADERDLTAIVVPCPANARLVRVAADDAPLRFVLRDGDGWRFLQQHR